MGHSAFAAGVTVTIVEASNVGVKVGMVGKGVIDTVGVGVGANVFVLVGIGDGVVVGSCVTVTGGTVPLCAQAVRISAVLSRAIKICFSVLFLLSSVFHRFDTTKTDRFQWMFRPKSQPLITNEPVFLDPYLFL